MDLQRQTDPTQKQTEPDDLVVLSSVKSLVIGGIACGVIALLLLCFGVVGIFGLLGGNESGGIGWWILYLVLTALGVLFLVCAVLVWRLDPAPTLLVNKEGIIDAGDIGLIPWNEITDITVFTHERTEYLGIVVTDLKALYARQKGLDRWLRETLRPNTHAIDSLVLSLPVAELAEAIRKYAQGRSGILSRPALRE